MITGGTSGIGQHAAIALARRGEQVVVTGRDQDRGLAGLQSIQRASGSNDVHLVLGDLARRTDILRVVRELRERFPRIDVLINNAGTFATSAQTTEDGFELCFAVNVAAPYAITKLLLPALEPARFARVLNVTGGRPTNALDPANLQAEKGFRGLAAYDNSKRAADAMSLALARELAPRGVYVNVIYPGRAATTMTRSVRPGHLPWWVRPLGPPYMALMRADRGWSAARASRSSVWAATAPELDGQSGTYFDSNCKPRQLHRTVCDPANQERVLAAIERVWGALT